MSMGQPFSFTLARNKGGKNVFGVTESRDKKWLIILNEFLAIFCIQKFLQPGLPFSVLYLEMKVLEFLWIFVDDVIIMCIILRI